MSLTEAAKAVDDRVFREIPVIDLGGTSSTDARKKETIASQIRDACLNVGFFYVSNHGISDEVIQDVYLAIKKFFDLPLDEKMKLDRLKTPSFKGYDPLLRGNNDPQNNGDLQEGFELGWEQLHDDHRYGTKPAGDNVWPTNLPGFREALLEYYHAALNLGRSLFPLFALALNLPENFFDDKTKHAAALMRALHYPPQTGPVDERVIGIGAHTDWECFTILWQEPDIQALQVLNPEKEWINAPPIPGTLVINLGDQFARWTNDVFRSTVHRAINRSGVRRYSIPLFFGTDYDVKLEPIPSCVSPDRPPKYEVMTAGEYVNTRSKAAYGHPVIVL